MFWENNYFYRTNPQKNRNMRKQSIIFLVMAILMQTTAAWAQKSKEETDAEALQRAGNEYDRLIRRDWEAVDADMLTMLETSWKMRLEEDENGVRRYVYMYGNGRANIWEEALEEAVGQAREMMHGPMIMYFMTWNGTMRMQGRITEEESEIIRNAVNDVQEEIAGAFEALDLIPVVQLKRPARRNQHEAHVRIFRNQMEVRQMSKEIIAKRLYEEHGWPAEKSFRLMDYPK